ncbi:MAG: adenosine deaminase family protein [Lachnospiraceae bacterium]|nr:adenosine deaminase family protein [Lachnospiraceae bacterium]
MIDLHLHFDGSLPVDTVWEQAAKQGIVLPASSKEELHKMLVCPADCESLNEYLEKFELPLSVLQTAEGIKESMMDLIAELISEDMLYAEIRFAPQLHLQKGLTQEEVVRAAIAGVEEATKVSRSNEGMAAASLTQKNSECDGLHVVGRRQIKVQLILCCMRGTDNMEANRQTVALTAKYLGKGVCACDLAGAEAVYKTKDFEQLFAYARQLWVPYTVHAGEADGPESVRAALAFGTRRLGHGVRSSEDASLVNDLAEQHITLECCPISNVQTKAVKKIQMHPIKEFLYRGIPVTVNTDNRTVSQTTIAREIQFLRDNLGLTVEEERQLYLNAADAAFISKEEREGLKNVITEII